MKDHIEKECQTFQIQNKTLSFENGKKEKDLAILVS